MFKNLLSNFIFPVLFYGLLFTVCFGVLPSSAQSYPSCSGNTLTGGGTGCLTPTQVNTARTTCASHPVTTVMVDTGSGAECQSGVNTYTLKLLRCYPIDQCTCPSGQIMNTVIDGNGLPQTTCIDDTGGEQPESVDTPQECGITGFPIWNGNGYDCVDDFDTPCPEGTTNGMYTLPGYDPRPYCADATPPNSSSAGSASSNSGQNSSSNNSDSNGDGSGSSSGNTGNSSSASSTGSGGNSSGSASSGQGGSASSAGAGECDPTAKNYLECLNSKELEIPSEKGSYDGTGGTSTEDRIGELEGELQGVVDQIKSEINDTIGVSLSGGGTLTDQCYQIMKVQVCFGWARWSQYLSLIANAIIAMAYIASFVIIMRQ